MSCGAPWKSLETLSSPPGYTRLQVLWPDVQEGVTLKETPKRKGRLKFPGKPVVKNLPCNAGDTGSIPGWGTQTLHAAGQLSLFTTVAELTLKPKTPQDLMKTLHAAAQTQIVR